MTRTRSWRTARRSGMPLLATGVAAMTAQAQTAQFIPIPAAGPGQNIVPFGISDDGHTVVGITGPGGPTQQAFRWTVSGGMQLLWQGLARDASADGSVIVGGTGIGTPGHAVRWTSGGGVQFLGAGEAHAVSADGTVAVGGTTGIWPPLGQAFRWTPQAGMRILPSPVPGLGAVAMDVSADGSIVTGYGATPELHAEAFRWSAGTGTVGLGGMPGGPHIDTLALAISADGGVIAGVGHGAFLGEAFRHTASGMVGLGGLPGMTWCIPYDASGDGSVLVGSFHASGLHAMIWDERTGIRSLQQVLADEFGLTLPGWNLDFANAISVDGTRITGLATNPLGQREGFLVVIPAPSGFIVLTLFGAAAGRRARRASDGWSVKQESGTSGAVPSGSPAELATVGPRRESRAPSPRPRR